MNFTDGNYTHHPMADYFNAMEPESYGVNIDNKPHVELGIQDIGMSVPMGIAAQNVAGIYSKIRMGAGKLEIQFPGYRVGNRNQQTPEMYGEDQRQALREMQLANEVRFNTHASFGLMGMMGRDERGNYSTYGAVQDLFELKRAIDFQADMGGGSVVMHSGEFERPMTDMFLDDETHSRNLSRDESGRLLVKQSHTQEFDAKFDLMDARTSQKMETVQKDRLVSYPVWNRAKSDYEGLDTDGNKVNIKKGDYIDYLNKQIPKKYWYDSISTLTCPFPDIFPDILKDVMAYGSILSEVKRKFWLSLTTRSMDCRLMSADTWPVIVGSKIARENMKIITKNPIKIKILFFICIFYSIGTALHNVQSLLGAYPPKTKYGGLFWPKYEY